MLISLVLEVPLMDFYGGATPGTEEGMLSLRDPMAFRLARLAETLPDLYRHRIYKLVEAVAKECGQPMEDPLTTIRAGTLGLPGVSLSPIRHPGRAKRNPGSRAEKGASGARSRICGASLRAAPRPG